MTLPFSFPHLLSSLTSVYHANVSSSACLPALPACVRMHLRTVLSMCQRLCPLRGPHNFSHDLGFLCVHLFLRGQFALLRRSFYALGCSLAPEGDTQLKTISTS